MTPRTGTFAFALLSALAGPFAGPLLAQRAAAGTFGIDYWNTESGLPQNSVNSVVQTRDGYLWLGTLGGSARFDGTTFKTVTTGDYAGLRSDRVRAIVDDRAGRIWIGTEDGLSRFDHGRVTTFGVADGLPGAEVTALASAADGSVWFGTANGALGRADATGIHVIIPALGALGNAVEDLLIDTAGTAWVSAHSGVWRFDASHPAAAPVQVYATPVAGLGRARVSRLAADREPGHGVWITTDTGIVHLTASGVQSLSLRKHPEFDPRRIRTIATSAPQVLWLGGGSGELWRFRADSDALVRIDDLHAQTIVSVFVDREGSVWVGDRITGLARVRPTLFQAFTQADGLPQDNVVSVFADSHDRVWVAARCAGAAIYEGATFRPLSREESGNCVAAFAEDETGDVWIGGDHVTRWRNGRVIARFDTTSGLPPGVVRAIVRGPRGTMWIATPNGLASWDGSRMMRYDGPAGVGARTVRTIYAARDGTLWLGAERGLLHFANGRFDRFTIADGLPHDFVRAIREDSSGALWIATYGGGLARLQHGKFQSFTTRDGLYDNYLSSIADDSRGNFWFSSNRGVFRISQRELNRFAVERTGRLHSVAYGRSDGLPSSEANGGFQSGVAQTSDGRFWYPTVAGLGVIDPARALPTIAPAVTIERVSIDGKALDSTNALAVGPDISAIEIGYAGLSLSSPNAVSFRYRLENWDRDWIDAGTRRSATYSRLPHGTYRFRLAAANREGMWAADTATLSFTILPHFWQTWWFRLLAAIGIAGAAFGAVTWRVKQVRAATAAAERSAAQRREAQILESVTDGFFALDREGRFTYLNGTAQRVLGRPTAELLGESFWDSFPAARDTITERELRRAELERAATVFEAPDTPTRGTWLEMHVYPTDDGMSVYFADVTGRKQAEEELRSQKEEIEAQAEELAQQADELARQNEVLEENVRLKDEVERISRHDLRTPLNTIISLSQIVREDAALAPEHETSLKLIEQAGYRVMHMASLTLDLFKMEQGTYVLDARPVDIRVVIDRALLDLEPMMRTRDITAGVIVTGFGGLRPLVLGDELLAQAMMGNIVKNAVEASPNGGTVTIEIAGSTRVHIHVHNAGVVPPEVRPRFFEKYVTAGKKGGTGLGAYSARLMARTQGGDVSLESTSERGTTVTIDLPAAPAAAVTPAGSPGASAVDAKLPARAILIVDDDASNRIVLRRFLNNPSWTVDEAENGPLAVSLAAERKYDVVFMDIEMPVMDGFEATQRIRAAEQTSADHSRTRIIAFSSHDDALTRERALSAGCDRYLTKPATRQAIAEVVLGDIPIPASVATLDPAIRDLVPAFVERKRAEVDELVAAVAALDLDAARRISHRLRGSFAVYGFADASAVCASIEEAARDGRLDEAADKQARSLYDHLRAIDGAAASNEISAGRRE